MKKIYSVSLSVLMNFSAYSWSLKEVEKNFQDYVSKNEIKGAILHYKTPYEDGYLISGDLGKGSKKVSPKTIFEVGSITKVITAHLIGVAAAEGRLKWDDPVSQFLPEIKANPAFEKITLRMLAQHTSGLETGLNIPLQWDPREKVYEYLLQWKPQTEAGKSYLYSNIGIGMLGFVLESVYKKHYFEILKEKLLKPLSMNSTFLSVPKSFQADFAVGFDKENKAQAEIPAKMVFYSAALIKTSSSDLMKYSRFLLDVYADSIGNKDKKSRYFKKTFDFLRKGALSIVEDSVCFEVNSCQGSGIELHPFEKMNSKFMVNHITVYDNKENPVVSQRVSQPQLSKMFLDKTGSSRGMSGYFIVDPSSQITITVNANKAAVQDNSLLGRTILKMMKDSPKRKP